MRRGFSPTRSRTIDDYPYYPERVAQDRLPARLSDDHKFFCHYNNAVYMGGMLSSEKQGKGLLLHDDGATVISEYQHDTPSGHNIIFRDNSITSILFRTTLDYDIAYKVDRFIIKIPFIDSTHRANGQGCLIDYTNSKVFELDFEDGAIVNKVLQLDRRSNEDVFRKNSITRAIGVKHEQAFELTFERPQGMHVKHDLNELTLGYYNERGEIHGLAAKIYAQNVEASGKKSLCLKTIERGYYRNSQLETFGEKYFSNGNRYIGEFKEGEFEGNGILVCPQEMKWVYGTFADGRLSEVIDSNSDRHTENDYQMWIDGLWDIHKRYSERWIDLNVELPDELYLYRILQEALKMQTTHVEHDRQESLKEGKMRLNKLQHQFIEGYPGNVERSYVDQELDRHYTNEYDYNKVYTPKSQDQWRSPRREDQVREYRMKDPFIDSYRPEYARSRLEGYYPDETYRSTPRRRPRFYEDLPARYVQQGPVEGTYRPTYFESLERQRGNLKRLEREDKDYLNNLRNQLARSPIHRNYLPSPTKYDPNRYNDKPIYKKYFNYKDPNAAYVHRWPQDLNSSRDAPPKSPKYEDYADSPPRPSRNPPYLSPAKKDRDYSGNNGFVQNNYKYWR